IVARSKRPGVLPHQILDAVLDRSWRGTCGFPLAQLRKFRARAIGRASCPPEVVCGRRCGEESGSFAEGERFGNRIARKAIGTVGAPGRLTRPQASCKTVLHP